MPVVKKHEPWTGLTDHELALLHQFVTRVNVRANQDILNGGQKASAHHRAMTLELMDAERSRNKCINVETSS